MVNSHPPHEDSRQTRASGGRDLEATLTPLPSRARRRPSPTPLVLPCQAERGCPQRRSGARPQKPRKRRFEPPGELHTGWNPVGSAWLPRCAASSPRSWWASQPPRLELGCLLGAAALLIRLVLQGPQGAQRRLLGLGEPPDARDSESLVGPVATQGAQVFAAVHIPEPDGPIIAATGDSFAIGAHLEGLHLPLMGFSIPVPQTGFPQARSALQVPPAQSAITPSTDEPIPDRMPGDCIEHTR